MWLTCREENCAESEIAHTERIYLRTCARITRADTHARTRCECYEKGSFLITRTIGSSNRTRSNESVNENTLGDDGPPTGDVFW